LLAVPPQLEGPFPTDPNAQVLFAFFLIEPEKRGRKPAGFLTRPHESAEVEHRSTVGRARSPANRTLFAIEGSAEHDRRRKLALRLKVGADADPALIIEGPDEQPFIDESEFGDPRRTRASASRMLA
jgi:hypothetical protein